MSGRADGPGGTLARFIGEAFGRAAIQVEPVPDLTCGTCRDSHRCFKPVNQEEPCECDCCDCDNHLTDYDHRVDEEKGYEYMCVGKAPYYGPETYFYNVDGQTIPPQTIAAAAIRPG